MKNNIVIIGTGNIGKRHLQAVGNLRIAAGIVCYDNIEESLNSVHPFCKANNIDTDHLDIRTDYKNTLDAITPDSIVVIATTAKGRKDILLDVLAKRPKAVIAEKPLCQSDEEYKQILVASKANNVPVYVNFARHAFEFYKKIKQEIRGAGHKTFVSVFPDGMSVIGIHILELMTWLLDVKEYKVLFSRSTKKFETKRPGYHDCFGEILLSLDGGNTGYIKTSDGENVFTNKIITENKEFDVFEFSNKMTVSDRSNIEVRDIQVLYVSQITDKIISSILSGGDVALPTIEGAYTAHRILFDFIKANSLEGINIT